MESLNNDHITLFGIIVDKGVLPNFKEYSINKVVNLQTDIHGCRKINFPCRHCKPLVHIMWQALSKGLDLNVHVDKCACGKALTLTDKCLYMLKLWRSVGPCQCRSTDPSNTMWLLWLATAGDDGTLYPI